MPFGVSGGERYRRRHQTRERYNEQPNRDITWVNRMNLLVGDRLHTFTVVEAISVRRRRRVSNDLGSNQVLVGSLEISKIAL